MSLSETRAAAPETFPESIPSLGLPNGMEFFVASGLHHLFERVDLASEKPVERSWLYLPSATLEQVGGQIRTPARTKCVAIGDPVEAEDVALQPVFGDGRLMGLLSSPQSCPRLTDEQIEALGAFGSRRRQENEVDDAAIAVEFAQELFQRDDGAEQFLKRLLSLLVGYWPRSSAGVYVEYQGLYQLRMVVGHVMRCHELPSHLSQDTTFRFLEALLQHENLVPAESLPNSPTFLNLPPDFFFVHQGLKSERTNQLLVMIGGGGVTPMLMRKVRIVARMLASLQESQFATTRELVDFYSRIGAEGASGVSVEAEVRDLYNMVSHQISASRLMISRFNSAGAFSTTWTASGFPTTQVRVAEGSTGLVPEAFKKEVLEGHLCHIPDITQSGLTEQEAKQRYLENVHSELFVPIRRHKRTVGTLEIGSSIAGDYLTRFSSLFEAVAAYTGTLIAMESLAGQIVIPGGEKRSSERSTARLITARKLLEGFLHSLSSRVSVLVGQTELLNASNDDPQLSGSSERAQLEKITVAGNELASQMGSLRTIVGLLEAADDGALDGAQFLRELPVLFEGFTRRIKDTRNVDVPITFTAAARQSYRLRMSDAIDSLLPFLMAVMEQAICSGNLSLQGNSKGNVPNVSLQFRKTLLGYVTVDDLLTRLFPDAERISVGTGDDQYRFNGISFSSRLISEETYHMTFTCGAADTGTTTSNHRTK